MLASTLIPQPQLMTYAPFKDDVHMSFGRPAAELLVFFLMFSKIIYNAKKSGCVTSAETVMLEKQSLDEFLLNLNKGKAVIVSVSPQSRSSLAVYFGLSPLQVLKKLTILFKSLGVKAIFDTSCSRDLTLIESCNEFITRYKQCHSTTDDKAKLLLPMISSACPCWICYAEKSIGSYILPYISSVKSPQQTIGSVIKKHICQMLCLRFVGFVGSPYQPVIVRGTVEELQQRISTLKCEELQQKLKCKAAKSMKKRFTRRNVNSETAN